MSHYLTAAWLSFWSTYTYMYICYVLVLALFLMVVLESLLERMPTAVSSCMHFSYVYQSFITNCDHSEKRQVRHWWVQHSPSRAPHVCRLGDSQLTAELYKEEFFFCFVFFSNMKIYLLYHLIFEQNHGWPIWSASLALILTIAQRHYTIKLRLNNAPR